MSPATDESFSGVEENPISPIPIPNEEGRGGMHQLGNGDSERETQTLHTTESLKKILQEIYKLEEDYDKTEEKLVELQKEVMEMFVQVMTVIDPEACYYAAGNHLGGLEEDDYPIDENGEDRGQYDQNEFQDRNEFGDQNEFEYQNLQGDNQNLQNKFDDQNPQNNPEQLVNGEN